MELAGGNDDIKTLFFPMALEAMPLHQGLGGLAESLL
jgi:hypothetical protein